MNLGSIAGISIGTFLATRSPESALKVFFGIFLLFIVVSIFLGRNAAEKTGQKTIAPRDGAGLTALGFSMGLLGAVFGMGGGTVSVPILTTIFRMPLKHAIATSLATIIVSSSLGAIIYFYLSSGVLFSAQEALLTAGTIEPGSIIGAMAGAKISERLHIKYIRYIFYAVLLYIAYNMIKSGLGW